MNNEVDRRDSSAGQRAPHKGSGDEADFWVFGYGSLMWNPGFGYLERCPGLLTGYHRAFCVYSTTYRGTTEQPGLVLGLARGGSCRGIAYRIAPDAADAVRSYLYEREMGNYIYVEKTLPVRLADRRIEAHTYVADWRHENYAGDLSVDEIVDHIRRGHGERGPNAEYLINTVRHLEDIGIREGKLHELLERLSEAVPPD